MGQPKIRRNEMYISEIDTIVYLELIVKQFESKIDALDYWNNEKQTLEFEQQGLFFEAKVYKSDDEVCICEVYANTPKLDVLDDLEETLSYMLEQKYHNASNAQKESYKQSLEIRKDQNSYSKYTHY